MSGFQKRTAGISSYAEMAAAGTGEEEKGGCQKGESSTDNGLSHCGKGLLVTGQVYRNFFKWQGAGNGGQLRKDKPGEEKEAVRVFWNAGSAWYFCVYIGGC
ncbi:MAG: hypothetical protein NC112_08405 [Oxalobacter formigenes]|nr:hypothetical protein [Oxalobacter formigenes]